MMDLWSLGSLWVSPFLRKSRATYREILARALKDGLRSRLIPPT